MLRITDKKFILASCLLAVSHIGLANDYLLDANTTAVGTANGLLMWKLSNYGVTQ